MRENVSTYINQLLDQDDPFLAFRYTGGGEVVVLSKTIQNTKKPPTDKIAVASLSKFKNIHNQLSIYFEVIKRFSYDATQPDLTISDGESDDAGREKHLKLVQKGVDLIQNSSLEKVVLSRKRYVNKPINIVTSFLNACARYPDAFCYLLYHPEVGLWMGATPETLVKFQGNRFYTMSLAGTRLKDEINSHPWTDKEMQEQKIVTDYILGRLKKLSVEDLKIHGPETVNAGNLVHLKTDISGRIDSEALKMQVVDALHPTPAVCGFPLTKAKQFILQEEGYERSLYTGYIGIDLPELPETYFVNLRCLRFTLEGAEIFVGGGITADSDPEEEWLETVNKAQTMAAILVADT